jgi:preprotein translocase subunit SecE
MEQVKEKENKLIAYLRESRHELKKVTWPTKKETLKYTSVVFGISIFVAILLGGLDMLFSALLKLILK